MANIKTREINKGTIKTIDRSSMMMQHVKQASLKVKDASAPEKRDFDSPDNYAQNHMQGYSRAVADRTAFATFDVAKAASKRIHLKRDMSTTKMKEMIAAKQKGDRYRKVMMNKAKHKMAARKSLQIRHTARTAEKEARRSANAMVRFVRRVIAGARAMLMAIGTAGFVAVIIVTMCVFFGAAFYFFGDEASSYTAVSPEVEAYTPVIRKYAAEYGIPQYTELVKAVMMQESGGRGLDPMQASECKYNVKYPKTPNGIKNPEYSIVCGVRYLRDNLDAAKAKSPVDMDRIKLALQGYNFGTGYISWAVNKYGGYSYAGAVKFSREQARKNGWNSYGDVDYVEHVLRYYPYGNYSYDVINTGPGKLGLPIKGMKKGHISSHFGPRSSPGGIGSTDHKGIDIAFPTGTKVLACESGTVVSAGWAGVLGKCVVINHGGNLQTVYAHLSKTNVRSGQKVIRGQHIGNVGSTGKSTGAHLHLGVKLNGRYVNPERGWLSIP